MADEAERVMDLGDVLNAIILQQARLYDMLVVIARNINPDETNAAVAFHEMGGLMSPPLRLREDDESS